MDLIILILELILLIISYFLTQKKDTLLLLIMEYQTGTLILVAKFRLSLDSIEYPAIMLVADDGVMKANDGADEDEFIKQARALKGQARVDYLKKNAAFTSNKDKVYDLGYPASRGLMSIAGDRKIYDEIKCQIRDKLTTRENVDKAADAREQLHSLAKLLDRQANGEIVHVQISGSHRHVFKRTISEATLPRLLGSGVGINSELLKTQRAMAIGLGQNDATVQNWLTETFGLASELRERVLDRLTLNRALNALAQVLQGTYNKILGSTFRGYVLIDIPSKEGPSSLPIN